MDAAVNYLKAIDINPNAKAGKIAAANLIPMLAQELNDRPKIRRTRT